MVLHPKRAIIHVWFSVFLMDTKWTPNIRFETNCVHVSVGNQCFFLLPVCMRESVILLCEQREQINKYRID